MIEDSVHIHVDNLSLRRSDGTESSAVARAAYISGTALFSEREQRLVAYSGRLDVVLSHLYLPDGAPVWAYDSQLLWNRVEASARRRDARLAKTLDAAIPRGVNRDLWEGMLETYVGTFTRLGMVAEAAIHEDGTGHNPHVHVMLTVSALEPEGLGAKLSHVDQKAFVTLARRGWESVCNAYLKSSGSTLRVNALSYRARGIEKTPTKHRGPDRQERQRRRAQARRLREEPAMAYQPSADERQTYPLLTQREDWPPVEQGAPVDLSPAERHEFDRYWHDRRQDAERAARTDFFEKDVPSWWSSTYEPRDPTSPAPQQRADRAPDWWKKPSYLEQPQPQLASVAEPEQVVEQTEWRQVSLDDFQASPEYDEFAQARHAYEEDLWRRAINMHRTGHEHQLIKAAENSSPQMRKQVENFLFQKRIEKLRAKDDEQRLKEFEDRLGHDVQDAYDAYQRSDGEDDRLPVPGPYGRLEAPSEQRQGQDEMIEEYHREDDRDEPAR
jgi:hypothetical protein